MGADYRGKTHVRRASTRLPVFAHQRHACAHLSRQVATGDGQRKRDVFDQCKVGAGKVALVHLDADNSDPPDIGLARQTCRDPADDIISAIDLVAWLNGPSASDREMLELRAAGYTLGETGQKLRLSTSAVFSRCRQLGADLAERMGVAIGVRARASTPTRSARSTSSGGAVRRCAAATAACVAA